MSPVSWMFQNADIILTYTLTSLYFSLSIESALVTRSLENIPTPENNFKNFFVFFEKKILQELAHTDAFWNLKIFTY